MQPGEPYDSPRAKAQAGTSVAVVFHDMAETTPPGSLAGALDGLGDKVEAYRQHYLSYPEGSRYLHNHRGHLMVLRPEERQLISADLIQTMTFTGEKAALRERLRTLEDAGYQQFTIQVVEGQESALEDWAEVFF